MLVLGSSGENVHRFGAFLSIMDWLNNIEITRDFTYKLENNNPTLPFFDILLINKNNKLEYKVLHKYTNRNDHLHF